MTPILLIKQVEMEIARGNHVNNALIAHWFLQMITISNI